MLGFYRMTLFFVAIFGPKTSQKWTQKVDVFSPKMRKKLSQKTRIDAPLGRCQGDPEKQRKTPKADTHHLPTKPPTRPRPKTPCAPYPRGEMRPALAFALPPPLPAATTTAAPTYTRAGLQNATRAPAIATAAGWGERAWH